jgi:hypothetical protein
LHGQPDVMRSSPTHNGLLPPLVLVLGLGLGCNSPGGASASDGPSQPAPDAAASDAPAAGGGQDAATQDATVSPTDAPADTAAAETGAPSCASTFAAAVVKTCSTVADCVLVDGDDCCGRVKIAIKAGTEASFATAEAAYVACVPGCGVRGCFHADVAEEGGTPGAGQAIYPECRAGRCLSVVRNTPAGCTTNADCGAGRLCVSFVTNVGPTSMTTRQCQANPCSSGPLSCTCARSLCSSPTPVCAVQGDQVVCEDGRQ